MTRNGPKSVILKSTTNFYVTDVTRPPVIWKINGNYMACNRIKFFFISMVF